jgi:hypothetical protein
VDAFERGPCVWAALERQGTYNVPRYEIHIRGKVGPVLLDAFQSMSSVIEPAETVLVGSIPDQAALQALLLQIQSLGLVLKEVRRMPEAGPEESAAGGVG